MIRACKNSRKAVFLFITNIMQDDLKIITEYFELFRNNEHIKEKQVSWWKLYRVDDYNVVFIVNSLL
jgi:hypothetical protein